MAWCAGMVPSDPWDGFKGKHPTSNETECSAGNVGCRLLDVGRWMFGVRRFAFTLFGE